MKAPRVGDLVKCWCRPIQGLVIDELDRCLLVLWNERDPAGTIDADGTEWVEPGDLEVINASR